jgi:signal transduction histidine kinase
VGARSAGRVEVLQITSSASSFGDFVAGAVAFVLAGTVTRRLQQLRATTELLAEGQLEARAPEPGGAPEIRSLARSVNTMADRLDDLLRQQRAFAGDASHQLRTPLTALRVRLA